MKKICVITGSRADYGLMKPMMRLIDAHKDMHLSIITCGMHHSEEHGDTYKEVERDFPTAFVPRMWSNEDYGENLPGGFKMGGQLADMVHDISHIIECYIAPDLVIVLGDRTEAFAGAIAGLFCKCIVCHIHGGDVCRGYDNYMRGSITCISHVHFVATERSGDNVWAMKRAQGYWDEYYVYNVGAPGLDGIAKKYECVKNENVALVLYHPLATDYDNSGEEFVEIVEALAELGLSINVIYPNNDAGSHKIIMEIKGITHSNYVNLPRDEFLRHLSSATVLVGNSSCGLIEAPALRTPTVNIGIRQEGRERGASVIDCPPERGAIKEAVKMALAVTDFSSPYGEPGASRRIVDILQDLDVEKIRREMR